ncbi:FAD-binding monooxygenase [Sphingomonas sp.]|uniref:FAD-binding monooxygenase n=1 Tax=Sphingomonas sp. TaxID=28214 RepID=UPI002FCABB1A
MNGFRPGDPHLSEPAELYGEASEALPRELPKTVDVLIVGSGPAGLTLAAQLAAFPEIETLVVESRPGPLLLGQADGIACRTVEMFEAFGFSERVLKEAYWVNEVSFWKPDGTTPEKIVRHGRIQDTEDGLSEFPHVILNQARVHDFYLDVMRNSPTRMAPYYGLRLVDLTIAHEGPAKAHAFPVTARLERLDGEQAGRIETIEARFVVGCDGARSAVRQSLGRVLHGDSANQAWGVMDVLAVTDFPDIRLKATIHSAAEGSVLIIPREGGYLVRFYIELEKLNANERVSNRNVTVDRLIAAAQRILRPYTLEVKEVAWWSVYEIGQRLADRFDDLADEGAGDGFPRVFITGDACHTHSPKAGQGMNVSMQDSFNLGWKLAAVLTGRSAPKLLHTYSSERRAIAEELIEFDREFARMFSAKPGSASASDREVVDPVEFKNYFIRQGRFTAGTATRYRPSIITAEPAHQQLAAGFPIGMRFHSASIIRLADARPMELGHTVKADGRWRLFAFAADEDPADPSSGIGAFCWFLSTSDKSPVRRYTPAGADIDSVIDVRAIFQQPHRDLALEAMPSLLLPRKGPYGLIDYEKLFCADRTSGSDIFDLRGIDRERGCLVVVRPDQYVAHILPLDAYAALADFFAGFMVPAW